MPYFEEKEITKDDFEVYTNNEGAYDISKIKFTEVDMNPWYQDRENIKCVYIVNEIAPIYCSRWFISCNELIEIKQIYNLKTDNVTDMSAMFYGCEKLSSIDLSHFNTSNVINMNNMFANCSGLTEINVEKFDTKNVKSFDNMFGNNGGTNNFANSNSKIQKISGIEKWDTSSATSMGAMFAGLINLENLNISNFDTSNVTYMYAMFAFDKKIEQLDLSRFDTRNVSNTEQMFSWCTNLETILVSDSFTVTNVSESYRMFHHCDSIIGENGTRYDVNKTDKNYAVIDSNEHKVYFTLKK